MYTVLLAVDSGQPNAQALADTVVGFPGSPEEKSATVLTVHEADEIFGAQDEGSRAEWDEDSDFPESVRLAEETLESAGIAAATRRELGNPAEEILAVAEDIDADNIVIGGRKRSPTGKALFGSVTQSVLLDSDRTVTVVHNN